MDCAVSAESIFLFGYVKKKIFRKKTEKFSKKVRRIGKKIEIESRSRLVSV